MAEIKTQMVEVLVSDGTKMQLHWAGPRDGRSGPGIIVFQEAFGVNAHIRDIVARFAAEGYWAAAPELFHRSVVHFECGYDDFTPCMPHMQKITQAGLEADSQATFDWLKSQPKVTAGKIASIGFCLGGRASFVANASVPLRAAISFYGGGIAPDFLPLAAKQNGPILLFWGGLDQHIPSDKTRAVADALTQAKKNHIHVEISDADHGFFCNDRNKYNAQAASEAWAFCLSFLKNHV
jgi:carboxymethylenebutenolidase